MKKYTVIFLAIIVGFVFLFPLHVSAHFLDHDEDISVTLHVDPNDNPIPGKQANLFFLITDETKRFQLAACNCTVRISEQEKDIFQGKLIENPNSQPSIWGESLPYVFPHNGVYKIDISGTPKINNAFQPFTLSWYFKVDPNNEHGLIKPPQSDIPIIIGAVIGILLFIILFTWLMKKEIIDAEKNSKIKKKFN